MQQDLAEATRSRFVDQLLLEVRLALRWGSRNRMLIVVVACTLGLGIGVNAAVFEMIEALLLRNLPYRKPGELVLVNRLPLHEFFMSPAAFEDWKKEARFLGDASLFVEGEANLFGGSEPVHIRVANVSSNLFSLLGTVPLRGRTFRSNEQIAGEDSVVLLSYRLWQREFGLDDHVVGTQVRLNGKFYEVAGVLSQDFDFPQGIDAWLPSAHDPSELRSFGSVGRFVLGRLTSEMTVTQADAEQRAWMQNVVAKTQKLPASDSPYWHEPFVRRLQDQLVGTLRTPVLMVWGAALLVLFIGSINAAHLLLANFSTRRSEFGLRRTLGMSTGQLVRQLLLEQMVIAVAGGVVGMLLAHVFTISLKTMLPVSWPQTAMVKFDIQSFVFTAGLSILVGLIVAFEPCWEVAREANSLALSLVSGRTIGESRHDRRSLWMLNLIQTALVTVALVGSGLCIRTLINLLQVDLGYRPDKLLCVSVSRPEATLGRGPEGAREYYSEAAKALSNLPGVEDVSGVDFVPVRSTSELVSDVKAASPALTQDSVEASNSIVMPGYFRAMGIPLLYGGDFERDSNPKAEPTAIVSKSLGSALWGASNAVGQFATIDGGQRIRVIGVVGDIRFFGPRWEPEAAIYLPFGQQIPRSFTFVVRTATDPRGVALAVRPTLRGVSAVQPIDEVVNMDAYLAQSLKVPRSLTILFSVLAAVGLALAIIGTYGSVQLSINRSRKTLAVRLALGGTPRSLVVRTVLGSLTAVGSGLAVGSLLAILGGKLLESQMFGVRNTDPLVLASTLCAMLTMAITTSFFASRRILSFDPAVILRDEDR